MKNFALSLDIPSDEEGNEEPVEDYQEPEYEESEEDYASGSSQGEPDKEDEKQPEVQAKPKFAFGGLALEIDDEEQQETQDEPSKQQDESEHDQEEQHESEGEHEEESEEQQHAADDGIQVEGIESTGDISYKWVEALPNILTVEKGVPFSNFYTNYALRAISQEFKLIRKLTETKSHTEQIAKRQKGKDRYGDLGPYKHTQVKLRSKEKAFDTTIDNYINANHVKSAKQRSLFIATQGPLETGHYNFWRMVWQEKVAWIFMLCPLKEGEKKKCSEYWPNENTEPTMIVEEFEIKFIKLISSTNDTINSSCKVRELEIKNTRTGELRKVNHYNYLTWPDFGTPDEEDYCIIDDMLDKISDLENNERSKDKIIVHCSAGIGRTGTLISIYN